MHCSALKTGKLFFDTYAQNWRGGTVVDVGACDLNGSLRQVCPPHLSYVGVDTAAGKGVDIVLNDPYSLPLDSASADAVVCTSCFEHVDMFWVLFLEILRVLKPTGLLYLNVPSNGPVHRHPADCWRFYPDSGIALVAWGKRNGYDALLLESFVGRQDAGPWNDFVAVIARDAAAAGLYPARILHGYKDFTNGRTAESDQIIQPAPYPEDQQRLMAVVKALS